jgi:hypothetical protein
MILKVGNTLINLANMTTATVTHRRCRFSFVVLSDSTPGYKTATQVFEGEEAAALNSYLNGYVYSSVIDNPFVDVMAHYKIAKQRATNPHAQ